MKSFNRNSTVFGAGLCMLLFFGTVLISTTYSEKPATNDASDEIINSAENFHDDSSDKPRKPAKSDKTSAEDFVTDDGGDDDSVLIQEEHPVIPELEFETYIKLAKFARLDNNQQKKLVIIQLKREKALEKWDKTHTKRLDKLKDKLISARGESRRQRLELQIKKLEDKRDDLAKKFDTKARRVCKKDQLVAYNSKLLYQFAMDEFYEMQFQLSNKEAAIVKKACDKYARKKLKNPKVDLYRQEKKQKKGVYEIARMALSKKQLKEFIITKKREELQRRREQKEQYEREHKNNRRTR